ncbi:MAG TPA: HD domain-containing phosphohydrolase [Candidatus Limnocylindria bacterium]
MSGHHHHPELVAHKLDQPTAVRTSELIGALSTALDLTEGLLAGHAARTCWIALRMAERAGMAADERESLFYAALLKDAGCSSNAAALTSIFGGDERALKRMQSTAGRSTSAMAVLSIRGLSAAEPLPLRIRRLVHVAVRGSAERRAIEHTRCERGAQIAMNAGFGPRVSEAVSAIHEHWDGRGLPLGLRGHEIPLYSRMIAVAAALDVFVSAVGAKRAIRTLRDRRGAWYQAELVDLAIDLARDGLAHELTEGSVEERIGEMEPDSMVRVSDEADVDRIAMAFADVVDAKSPFTGSHSRNVAAFAESLADELGLPPASARDVRRGGLLHDIGKLGVPNRILDKPDRLTADEYLQIREHPELSLRILQPVAIFSRVAEIAAAHHERMDGTGYYRGLDAERLAIEARVVAVADVYEALTADRPYRAAMTADEALEVMGRMAGDHLATEVLAKLPAVIGR